MLGLNSGEDAINTLIEYAELLIHAGSRFNLVSRKSLNWETLWRRHLFDSLRAAPELSGSSVADVGSGAGLPGIPLAIVRKELDFTLIDRSARRCDFLHHAKMKLGLGWMNVEEAMVPSAHLEGRFDTVVARGLAKPEAALAMLLPLTHKTGRVVLFVGRGEIEPLTLPNSRYLKLLAPQDSAS